MNLLAITFQLLVGLSLLAAATITTFRPQWSGSLISLFAQSGVWRIIQAAALWIALVMTLAGIAVPFVAFFASCVAFALSIPLIFSGVRSKIPVTLFFPIVLAIAAVMVAIAQPLGLKVLALPKADELPFNASNATVIKTYDEGLHFEGIAAAENGTLYLSGNRGLDFSRNDYYHDAQGELIERKADGSERVLFKTPNGTTSGVPVITRNNSIYLTSHGETSTIWHIDTNGKAERLAQFPEGAWPNGLDEGPDGMLYSPDASLGYIWRVDPRNGNIEMALRDPALLARPFISLAPGANGLHFRGNDLYVTVSDRAVLLKYSMDSQGKLGSATVIASGIPGDDFAIGQDGSFFITTHPYNTVVRVLPTGERVFIGKTEQHVTGATDAVLGRTTQDQNTLYVVTDGGAFTGGAKMRGDLVALTPFN